MAELKAAGQLPESVELKPGQIRKQHGRTRPSLYQTSGQARDGLLFVGDRVANPCRGYEGMHMLRKGQMRGVEKGDILGQVAFIASIFGVAV